MVGLQDLLVDELSPSLRIELIVEVLRIQLVSLHIRLSEHGQAVIDHFDFVVNLGLQ